MAETLRDVAELAGVSISTASRALTGDRERVVAPETRERVLDAVRRLNYQRKEPRSRAAQAGDQPANRAYRVGLILGHASYKFLDPYWAPVLHGVDEELTRSGHLLRFAFTEGDLERLDQHSLISRSEIDGLLLMGGAPDLQRIAALGPQRTVRVSDLDDQGRWVERPAADVIAIEKRRSMYRLVEHLVSLGRRSCIFLGPSPLADERAEAFLDALVHHGSPFEPARCIPSPWTAEGAYEVARALLARQPLPDAVVCGCDTIAVGVMRAAKEQGLRLPDDLAITGFDDIAFARDLDPPLTTIHVPKEFLGELAVRELIERIETPDRPTTVRMVQTTLVVRRSCGAHST